VAAYTLNPASVAHALELIAKRQYVLDSDWGDAQPGAEAQNHYLDKHSWHEYASWHLGLTDGATDETKARYAFVYGDFRRLHRSGLIACVYRASEWRHKEIELAAHDLLQRLDAVKAANNAPAGCRIQEGSRAAATARAPAGCRRREVFLAACHRFRFVNTLCDGSFSPPRVPPGSATGAVRH
jgi:hypothetical protein